MIEKSRLEELSSALPDKLPMAMGEPYPVPSAMSAAHPASSLMLSTKSPEAPPQPSTTTTTCWATT